MSRIIKLVLAAVVSITVILSGIYFLLVGISQQDAELIQVVTETIISESETKQTVEQKKEIINDLLPADPVDTVEEKQEAINLLDQLRSQ